MTREVLLEDVAEAARRLVSSLDREYHSQAIREMQEALRRLEDESE